MNIHKLAEIISLSLTVPTVLLSAVVIVIWGKSSLSALKSKKRTGADWLIMGVIVSFIGSSLDNVYWGLAWGADFLGMASRDALFHHGVYANIPFRQIAGVIAAFCHIRGALSWSVSKGLRDRPIHAITLISCILCIVTCVSLLTLI